MCHLSFLLHLEFFIASWWLGEGELDMHFSLFPSNQPPQCPLSVVVVLYYRKYYLLCSGDPIYTEKTCSKSYQHIA